LLNLESLDIQKQKINELQKVEELKNIFPEIFEDGKLNIEKFKNILFDIKDEKTEHYNFNWNGKQDCYKIIKQKSNLTLKVDNDKTIPDGNNVFIEGDNLEVLKLLQTSYHKKIKMIYIDPPYNKDKDFVYSDTWGDTITNYLIQTDQLRDEGYTSTKTSSSGRRHTNWLNMIYPRLWLSRNLLKDDGVIFVSIDDDEVHNLRKVMDEIYGEENFVAEFIWEKKKKPSFLHKNVGKINEYILCYVKNKDNTFPFSIETTEDNKKYPINNAGNSLAKLIFPAKSVRFAMGDCIVQPQDMSEGNIKTKLLNELIIKNNTNENEFTLEGEWRYNQTKIDSIIKSKEIILISKIPFRPNHIKDGGEIKKMKNCFSPNHYDMETNEDATEQIRELLKGDYFDTPKPVKLIKTLIKSITYNDNDAIILDFFAGSGTTAHAVMELNQDDEKDGKVGNRKYILVQLPEATEKNSEAFKNNYKKISEITKARIKKVIEKLDYKDGFKSYKLDSSNFQVFKELKKRPNDSLDDIVKMLKMSVFNKNIFTQNAKEIDIVYEVGLKNGFSLSAKSEIIKNEKYNFIKLYEENREFYFCFVDKIELDIAGFIPKDAKLICFDKALDDSTKMNLKEKIDLETL